MLVYGVGNHILDMLMWHPDLAERIERIFDKNPLKVGKEMIEIGKVIESPEKLKDAPAGTKLAIAAIRYMDEITEEIRKINPEIECINIDQAYFMPEEELSASLINENGQEPVNEKEKNQAANISDKDEEKSGGITKEDVINCYKDILGREPDSEKDIDHWLKKADSLEELENKFFSSEEFKKRFKEGKFLVDDTTGDLRYTPFVRCMARRLHEAVRAAEMLGAMAVSRKK